MKIIVAGGRDFAYRTLEDGTQDMSWHHHCVGIMWGALNIHITASDRIVHGGAKGADRLAAIYAREYFYKSEAFPADWDTHGKAAGPIRNQEMAEYADVLVAVWDGKSRGTKNMIETALKEGLEVHVYRY